MASQLKIACWTKTVAKANDRNLRLRKLSWDERLEDGTGEEFGQVNAKVNDLRVVLALNGVESATEDTSGDVPKRGFNYALQFHTR